MALRAACSRIEIQYYTHTPYWVNRIHFNFHWPGYSSSRSRSIVSPASANRDIHARKNNAHARTEMARIYNNHHVQSYVVRQYVTANISRLDRAATDNKRMLCRIVDIAGSKEQPGYKLRCLYGLLKVLHPTSALVAVSTAIQQSQGYLSIRLGTRSL